MAVRLKRQISSVDKSKMPPSVHTCLCVIPSSSAQVGAVTCFQPIHDSKGDRKHVITLLYMRLQCLSYKQMPSLTGFDEVNGNAGRPMW